MGDGASEEPRGEGGGRLRACEASCERQGRDCRDPRGELPLLLLLAHRWCRGKWSAWWWWRNGWLALGPPGRGGAAIDPGPTADADALAGRIEDTGADVDAPGQGELGIEGGPAREGEGAPTPGPKLGPAGPDTSLRLLWGRTIAVADDTGAEA